MGKVPAFGVEFRSAAQLPPDSDHWWDGVLGVAHFGAQPAGKAVARVPFVHVPMTPLQKPACVYEVWHAGGSMRIGHFGAVHYRATEQLLFGCLSITEGANATLPGAAGGSPLERATTQAYAEIFSALEQLGYPHLVRIWNYVASINAAVEAGERYWQFNAARQEVFLARHRAIVDTVPAASALGTPTGNPLVIYFLASPTAMQTLENPRQVSAFRYPTQYGPRSPTFSRAALLAGTAGCPLLVSGTASIVGHETMHGDDVAAQTRETLANIRALVGEANQRVGQQQFSIERLAYKVYVRNRADLPAVMTEVRAAVGEQARIAFLQADVCRRDLLVEIEAVGSDRTAAH
jgi:enamine deaminase RidA (YjgF/YER057c/UK114 family)